jgi:glycosyltransferase involved in cell wall biosynthesis
VSEHGPQLSVVLVDPSLFTAPYDAALDEGLRRVGVHTSWAVRPVRPGDRSELPRDVAAPLFYRHVDQAVTALPPLRSVLKGLAHVVGLGRLDRHVAAHGASLVHMQWTVLPLIDSLAIAALKRRVPVVLTVHDTVPHNGERASPLQRWGYTLPMHVADRLIVHTEEAAERLVAMGLPAHKIDVVEHGPLTLPVEVERTPDAPGARLRLTLFGELKHYKGIDVLIEALGLLEPELRARLEVVVSGRARMDVAPLAARAEALGLADTLTLRTERLSDNELAQLFRHTDCFVFPYRHVDASGAYYLSKSYARWTIASEVGVFKELKQTGSGYLFEPENVMALADCLRRFVTERPSSPVQAVDTSWRDIGSLTVACYGRALSTRRLRAPSTS